MVTPSQKGTISSFLESFLELKEEEFRLKYVFDYLRNIAIAGSVFYAGLYLIKNGSFSLNFIPYSGFIIGSVLAVSAFLLMCLNIAQGFLYWAKKGPKPFPYIIFNLIICLSILDLFYFWIKKYILS